jgi:Fibronectin type III domain
VPAAPSNLTATAVSNSQINLAWSDNSGNETGFKIERCQGNNCNNFAEIAQVGANVTSFPDTGLSANTRYRYRVRAFNAAGNSAYSNIAQEKTPRN